jgi:zeaxanthin glucosyltransferase
MKLAFVSLPVSGHLNPMTALARRLQSRGHEIVVIGVPDAEPFAHSAGLGFVAFGEKEFPLGSAAKLWGKVAKRQGLDVVRYSTQEQLPELIRLGLEYLPMKLRETGAEAVVLDTICFFHELAPMSLGMPYVHIWNVLHVDFSGLTPMCFFSLPHDTTPEGLGRNAEVLHQAEPLFAPMIAAAMPYAKKMGLEIDWSNPGSTVSKLAVVTQTPREFDFPGAPWPPQFHYAGPFHDDEGREPVAFPWEKLSGAPLIYGSLGTLVNGLHHVYRAILEAVEKLPETQVVLSVGKNIELEELGPIPSNVIAVRSAPQIELLKRATLAITHAGLNTALESLGQGVPMVAIPIGYDQPGVAARIAHHGVGEFVEVDDLTAGGLRELIRKVSENPSYRERACYFRDVIARTRGLDVAADVIEQALGANQSANAAGAERHLRSRNGDTSSDRGRSLDLRPSDGRPPTSSALRTVLRRGAPGQRQTRGKRHARGTA